MFIPCVTGIVHRRCIIDDFWEEFIECFRDDTRILFDQVIFRFDNYVKLELGLSC